MRKPKRILIVDDDRDNLFLLEVRLKDRGYQVLAAQSADEAFAIAMRECRDLVILDIVMPGTDGTELAQRFKREDATREIPIFFVTCLQTKEEEERPGFVVGRRMFAKPVDFEKLVEEIKNTIGH